MKKYLILSIVALCASFAYYVYASTPTSRANPGCIGKHIKECQVWYVNAEGGVGMILEEGKNESYVDEEPID